MSLKTRFMASLRLCTECGSCGSESYLASCSIPARKKKKEAGAEEALYSDYVNLSGFSIKEGTACFHRLQDAFLSRLAAVLPQSSCTQNLFFFLSLKKMAAIFQEVVDMFCLHWFLPRCATLGRFKAVKTCLK